MWVCIHISVHTLFVCMWGSVYICVYMLEEHVGLYERMCICLYTCLHICVWFHVSTHWRYMSTSIYSHIYSHIFIHTCMHLCAPGLRDGNPYSEKPRALWNRPPCCHIFSCCAQHLTRSKLSEDRFVFGLLFEEVQSSPPWQSIEAGDLVTGIMTSTV